MMRGYSAHACIVFCWAMVVGCTTGSYSMAPSDPTIKNKADQSAQQMLYTQLEAVWARVHVTDTASIIASIRSDMHAYFEKEPRQTQQWYSVAEAFITDKQEFFIDKHKQLHETIKRLCFALPMPHLARFVAEVGNAQNKAACIERFLAIAPVSSIEKLRQTEAELGNRLWVTFTTWIRETGSLARLPKQMQAKIEAGKQVNRAYNLVRRLFQRFRGCQKTLRPFWGSLVKWWGAWSTQCNAKLNIRQCIKATHARICQKIE